MLFTIFLVLFTRGVSKAQQKEKSDELKKERNIYGNRFRLYNNYVNFGSGFGKGLGVDRNLNPTAIAFNFHIKRNYFMCGYQRTDIGGLLNQPKLIRMNDVHFCYGFRRENKVFNIAYYGGISRPWGVSSDTLGFRAIGIYAEAQLMRKLFYDVGAGISVFGHYNKYMPLFGIRADIFLSGAYQGKINAD